MLRHAVHALDVVKLHRSNRSDLLMALMLPPHVLPLCLRLLMVRLVVMMPSESPRRVLDIVHRCLHRGSLPILALMIFLIK
jgi:hypothetical protein